MQKNTSSTFFTPLCMEQFMEFILQNHASVSFLWDSCLFSWIADSCFWYLVLISETRHERYKKLYIVLILHNVNAETITNVNVTAVERVESPSSHDLQIYGIVVTIVLCFIVFGGVRMINRVAPAFLVPVLFSLFCIFIGIFLARKDKPARECILYFHVLYMTSLFHVHLI